MLVHLLLSFMDVYFGCNQIRRYLRDEVHTTLYDDNDIFYYPVMLINLVKLEMIDQRMVIRLFKDMLGENIGAYT